MKRALKLETRYEYLRRDARILTAMCEIAAQRFAELAKRAEAGETTTPSDLRELASQFAQTAYRRGRGPGAKQR